MAFPALLVFASMYGSRRLFVLLMGGMLAVLVLLVALHQTGMLRSVADPFNLGRAAIPGPQAISTLAYWRSRRVLSVSRMAKWSTLSSARVSG